MCGIAGIFDLKKIKSIELEKYLNVMDRIQAHRGPDDNAIWVHAEKNVGFAHRRLSIIDLETGAQPMTDCFKNTIVFNGEIYNYIELKEELRENYDFKTRSDTEVILAAYKKWGEGCAEKLRGMFSFAIWDDGNKRLFCVRDRFGIKPFYYTITEGVFYFASEAKALLPFVKEIKTNAKALKDYLVFQFCLDGKTLFEGIDELLPAHHLSVKNGHIKVKRYWEVYYNLDFHHTQRYFEDRLRDLLEDSIRYHLRSDVPIGAYLSGGIDSSIIVFLAANLMGGKDLAVFNGRFSGDEYDESRYAKALAKEKNSEFYGVEIKSGDLADSIRKVIYHLDYPVAGPGSFAQYHVSKLASKHRKVVLGGQGGDEIFGGYVRYLIAYFEQCIKAAIDGTMNSGNFIVTYESIIPNLRALYNYKPLLKEFWKEGLFDDMDERYFRLLNRASSVTKEIRWDELGDYSPFDSFEKIFNGSNVGKESYFDKMTHFDFKTLLPALLQVEDRMSMAHGLESRVPYLDHPVVEFAASMPSNIKFKNGTLKMSLLNAVGDELPEIITKRTNKMGFPVPINDWAKKELKGFIKGIFEQQKGKKRDYFNTEEILKGIENESKFGRKLWGLLSLEIWHQEFHDKGTYFKDLLKK